ncbi:MAG: parallel beta-helix repeat containing protein [Sphingobacteriaceae bacterium]|jgi:parallel beta-helix repeat protein|nr:parallel beta-helix repeat containing protein [Sphingobacteriaceae bacterium]
MRDLRYKNLAVKLALSIFFATASLAMPQSLFAANYYFSSSTGNDQYTSQQARSPQTPWKTLSKLNSFFANIMSGDSILFKRGETFEGTITVTKSGGFYAPINFGAYGQGAKPVLTGFTTLSNWKLVGSGIYEAPCTSDGTILVINGEQKAMGRYPNSGYLSYESHVNNTSITDNQSLATNWTGGEVVIRKNRWTIEKSAITSQSGGTLTYATGSKATPTNNYGYFIQNHAKTLDQFGEWYYDAARKVMMVYFGSTSPSTLSVKTSSAATLIDIRSVGFINFDGLAFTGAGLNAFKISNSKNVTIKNSSVQFAGAEALFVSYSPAFTLTNSSITNSFGAINLDAGCTTATVTGNTIKDISLIAGSGKSGLGIYSAMLTFGDNALIEKNTFENIGYNGIYLGGNSSTVKNNFIQYFCLVVDDGAGVYVGDWSNTSNKKIIGNIILNGIGASAGTNSSTLLAAEGIYIDDLSKSVTVSGNTVSLCANNGIKIHDAADVKVFNNTVYNNGVQLRLEQDHYSSTSTYIRNLDIRANTFFSKSANQQVSKISTHQDDVPMFGQLDSNYYCRPVDELSNITTYLVRNGVNVNKDYDLSGWRTIFGKDAASKISPVAIPAYKVTGVLGSNKVANGAFDNNISGLYAYSTINDCTPVYSTGSLDGGALKLTFKSAAGNHVVVNVSTGAISANKNYLLKFSLLGSGSGKNLTTYLRKTGSPYTTVSNVKLFPISTSRTENEYLLTSTADIADASIIFEFDEPVGPVYIDNIKLTEAQVTKTNPADYILFEYNASSTAKTLTLSRPYVDVRKNAYSSKITINPYSSVLLIATDQVPVTATVVATTQTISFDGSLQTYGGTPLTLTPTASSGLPVTMRVVSGPAQVSGSTVNFSDYGPATIEAVQTGNESFQPASARVQVENVQSVGSGSNAIVTPTPPATNTPQLPSGTSTPQLPSGTGTSSPQVKTSVASNSNDSELRAYPNPFTNKLTVQFTIPATANGTLKLYDMQGRFINQIFSGAIKANELQSFTVDANNLGIVRGMYIVKLESDKSVLTQKVVLAK